MVQQNEVIRHGEVEWLSSVADVICPDQQNDGLCFLCISAEYALSDVLESFPFLIEPPSELRDFVAVDGEGEGVFVFVEVGIEGMLSVAVPLVGDGVPDEDILALLVLLLELRVLRIVNLHPTGFPHETSGVHPLSGRGIVRRIASPSIAVPCFVELNVMISDLPFFQRD